MMYFDEISNILIAAHAANVLFKNVQCFVKIFLLSQTRKGKRVFLFVCCFLFSDRWALRKEGGGGAKVF